MVARQVRRSVVMSNLQIRLLPMDSDRTPLEKGKDVLHGAARAAPLRQSVEQPWYAVLVGGFVLLIGAVYLGWVSLSRTSSSGLLAIVIFLLSVFVWKGLYVLQPNYSRVAALRQLYRPGRNNGPALGVTAQ